MADSNKRKERTGDDRDQRGLKRSKGGSGGKWKTPHQITKTASRGGGKIEPGDAGIWVTCAKGQEGRATEELKIMFAECAERFYGILAEPQRGAEDDEEEDEDIESSIKKEMELMHERKKEPKLFSPVHINAPCVLFFKTRDPIEPADFVHRICEEVVLKPGVRRLKYVNRLTPMTLMGRATEGGLEEVGKSVLGKHFDLSEVATGANDGVIQNTPFSYAIRPTIRTHKVLQRDAVIKQVAAMVGESHKVNLTKPDKVILVEIYQTVCGMSVVGDDWETLKRYNLAELYGGYKQAIQAKDGSLPKEPTPERASTNEAPRVS